MFISLFLSLFSQLGIAIGPGKQLDKSTVCMPLFTCDMPVLLRVREIADSVPCSVKIRYEDSCAQKKGMTCVRLVEIYRSLSKFSESIGYTHPSVTIVSFYRSQYFKFSYDFYLICWRCSKQENFYFSSLD